MAKKERFAEMLNSKQLEYLRTRVFASDARLARLNTGEILGRIKRTTDPKELEIYLMHPDFEVRVELAKSQYISEKTRNLLRKDESAAVKRFVDMSAEQVRRFDEETRRMQGIFPIGSERISSLENTSRVVHYTRND